MKWLLQPEFQLVWSTKIASGAHFPVVPVVDVFFNVAPWSINFRSATLDHFIVWCLLLQLCWFWLFCPFARLFEPVGWLSTCSTVSLPGVLNPALF